MKFRAHITSIKSTSRPYGEGVDVKMELTVLNADELAAMAKLLDQAVYVVSDDHGSQEEQRIQAAVDAMDAMDRKVESYKKMVKTLIEME